MTGRLCRRCSIIALIAAHGPLTAAAIGMLLKAARHSIRTHISRLAKQGVLEPRGTLFVVGAKKRPVLWGLRKV